MKIFKRIATILFVLIVLFFVTRNILIKVGVEQGVKAVTGLTLKVKSIKVGVFKTYLDIKELRLLNPEGYLEEVMIDIHEIYADYEFLPLLKKNIHIKEARLYLKELNIVRDREGRINLNSLKALRRKIVKFQEEGKAQTKGKRNINLQIDLLKLKIGKVSFTDYSQGDNPSVREMNVDLEETFENITNPNVLIRSIVFKALMSTGLEHLAILGLRNIADDTLTSTIGVAAKVVGVAGDTLKKTTEGVRSIIKLPFGTKEY